MHMTTLRPLVPLLVLAFAGGAAAQTVDGRTAGGMLFPSGTSQVALIQGAPVAPDQAALLAQVSAGQPYYGAIAISPDEGIMVEATVATANYHDLDAASAAAIAGCEAKRKGVAPCAIVAHIRPEGWQPVPLSLSAAATADFEDSYGRRGARALAASQSTGVWGIARGDDAALAAIADCAGKSSPPATDCTLRIAD